MKRGKSSIQCQYWRCAVIPTTEQAFECVYVCHMLSNLYRDIVVFRYNAGTTEVYILTADDKQNCDFPTGTLEVRLKPNFKAMTLNELRAYVKEHRTDDEAIRELFVNRRSPDETATWYSFPLSQEGLRQGEEVLRQNSQHSENRQPPGE